MLENHKGTYRIRYGIKFNATVECEELKQVVEIQAVGLADQSNKILKVIEEFEQKLSTKIKK